MHKYIYGAVILFIGYLLFMNNHLSDKVSLQQTTISNMQSSLSMARLDFAKKLQALKKKQISDLKITNQIKIKRKECENDKTAVAIVNLGVPSCMR